VIVFRGRARDWRLMLTQGRLPSFENSRNVEIIDNPAREL
jgi:hypothetical protein